MAGVQRATLAEAVTLPAAPGVLGRWSLTVQLLPAPAGSGLRVRRTDLQLEWPLTSEHVVPGVNCTAVGDARGSVAFVEHLLAALWGGGLSDVLVVVDGPEIPLYDGSAQLLWEAVQQAGREEIIAVCEPLVIKAPVWQIEGEKILAALPAEHFTAAYSLSHPHPLIGCQYARLDEWAEFGPQLAAARTWATAEQIRATRGEAALAEAESMCVVIYEDHVSEQPRLPQPWARHKLVDLLGDLMLLGRPLVGEIIAHRTGHAETQRFVEGLQR
jgi:UDP-3-O-[3-hydroxymyristoyl] N-acetylglucosamine deacetylase